MAPPRSGSGSRSARPTGKPAPRPLAPIVAELRLSGAGALVVGLGGLAAAVARRSGEPARVIVPFLAVALVVGLATTVAGSAWLRRAIPTAPPPAPGAVVEEPGRTRARGLLVVGVMALIIVLFLVALPGLAAVLAGAAAGSGGTDLRTSGWLAGQEREGGVQVLRASSWSPFAGARRAIYARPAPH